MAKPKIPPKPKDGLDGAPADPSSGKHRSSHISQPRGNVGHPPEKSVGHPRSFSCFCVSRRCRLCGRSKRISRARHRLGMVTCMAKPEHLAILKKGVEQWNKWREEHPQVMLDLTEAELSGVDLRGANLGRRASWLGGPHPGEPRRGEPQRDVPRRGGSQRGGPQLGGPPRGLPQ